MLGAQNHRYPSVTRPFEYILVLKAMVLGYDHLRKPPHDMMERMMINHFSLRVLLTSHVSLQDLPLQLKGRGWWEQRTPIYI